jgi:hypothetical protein
MRLFLIVILFFLPNLVFAQVEISEIMYDIDGPDNNREWIEIHNTSGSSIDLTGWKLFEADSNHKLTLVDGSEIIPDSGFAVIASDALTFLSNNTDFSGTLFDSSFSLSNTGETLTIRDSELLYVDSVAYSADWGAQGDGNSLQKSGNAFIPASPTPGNINSSKPVAIVIEEEVTAGEEVDDLVVTQPDPKKIFIDVGPDKTLLAGADSLFRANGSGTAGEPLENARYIWNFGDGTVHEGQVIFKNFAFPGKYVVFVQIVSGKYTASDSLIVTAKPSPLKLSAVKPGLDGFVELNNDSGDQIDVSFWHLRTGDQTFTFPHGTYILPKTKTAFPNTVTGFSVSNIQSIELLYPNGVRAFIEEVKETLKVSTVSHTQPVLVSNKKEESKIETKNIVIKDAPVETEIAPTSSSAIVLGAMEDDNNSLYTWLLALFGVMGASIVGFLLIKSNSVKTTPADDDDINRIVDDIEIID